MDALPGRPSRFELQRGNRTFDVTLEPLRDSMGTIIGCIEVALEITERKKNEDEVCYDGLTGLANYREFFSSLEREV